jgi:hypothetical protein
MVVTVAFSVITLMWRLLCGNLPLRPFFIFKLEEEGKPALLLLLPTLFAEYCFFGSAFGLGCWLVVAIAQAAHLRAIAGNKKIEKNGAYLPQRWAPLPSEIN